MEKELVNNGMIRFLKIIFGGSEEEWNLSVDLLERIEKESTPDLFGKFMEYIRSGSDSSLGSIDLNFIIKGIITTYVMTVLQENLKDDAELPRDILYELKRFINEYDVKDKERFISLCPHACARLERILGETKARELSSKLCSIF